VFLRERGGMNGKRWEEREKRGGKSKEKGKERDGRPSPDSELATGLHFHIKESL